MSENNANQLDGASICGKSASLCATARLFINISIVFTFEFSHSLSSVITSHATVRGQRLRCLYSTRYSRNARIYFVLLVSAKIVELVTLFCVHGVFTRLHSSARDAASHTERNAEHSLENSKHLRATLGHPPLAHLHSQIRQANVVIRLSGSASNKNTMNETDFCLVGQKRHSYISLKTGRTTKAK